jgi:D-serine deaminase-like pyridoxal phosphate-dependent protein
MSSRAELDAPGSVDSANQAAVPEPAARPAERFLGRPAAELPTPCLVVDIPRLDANIRRWQEIVAGGGKRFRPHIKTHKSPEIARRQLDVGAAGIAVAKVAEAEVFAAHGFDDIVVAYPVFGEEKWERLADLAGRVTLGVNVDSAEALRGLSAAAERAGSRILVHVDVDSGFHRGGVDAGDPHGVEELARLTLDLPGLDFDGVTTHRGMFFDGADGMSLADAGRDEGRVIGGVADALRERGIEVRQVSAGGTMTGEGAAAAPGVTEVRAGTYVFNDLMQLDFGSATVDQLALSIHCTVASARTPGRVTIDAGSKTFSGDRGVVGGSGGATPGIARGADLDVVLERITEEHGIVRIDDADVRLGQRIAFTPTHVCTTVNLSDELFGVRDGIVEEVWPVRARGKRT